MASEVEVMAACEQILQETGKQPTLSAVLAKDNIHGNTEDIAKLVNQFNQKFLADIAVESWNETWGAIGSQMLSYIQGLLANERKQCLEQSEQSEINEFNSSGQILAEENNQLKSELERLKKTVKIQSNIIMALKVSREAADREIQRYSECTIKEAREQIKSLLEINGKAETRISELNAQCEELKKKLAEVYGDEGTLPLQ